MRNHSGFSLVELLIALVLGVILINGVGYLLLSANKTYALQDQLIRLQENGRSAIELLTQDIRMSAYTGCPADAPLGNTLYTGDTSRLWMAHFDKGLLGIPAGTSMKKEVDRYALSEGIITQRINREKSFSVLSVNSKNIVRYSSRSPSF